MDDLSDFVTFWNAKDMTSQSLKKGMWLSNNLSRPCLTIVLCKHLFPDLLHTKIFQLYSPMFKNMLEQYHHKPDCNGKFLLHKNTLHLIIILSLSTHTQGMKYTLLICHKSYFVEKFVVVLLWITSLAYSLEWVA